MWTTEELLKFVAANTGPPDSRLERSMRDSHQVRNELNPQLAVGLNWQVWIRGDDKIIAHGGGTGGFQAFIGFDPANNVGAVVLINTKRGERHAAQDLGVHLINPGRFPLR